MLGRQLRQVYNHIFFSKLDELLKISPLACECRQQVVLATLTHAAQGRGRKGWVWGCKGYFRSRDLRPCRGQDLRYPRLNAQGLFQGC